MQFGSKKSALICGAAAIALFSGSAWGQTRLFDIPAEDANKAIPEFARQAGIQIVAPGDRLRNVQTPAIKGNLDTRVALSKLLASTDARIASDDGQTIILTAAPKKVAAAPDDRGAASAIASPVEQVVVTGSRGRERTVTGSSTPIDVVPGSEIANIGQSSTLSALRMFVPSFNEPLRSGGASASIIETGGLRGLNPDQTLILVNGKRRHKTALINAVGQLYNGSDPVDLDMIPASLIEHIEVLRDGAAAQYGSDAIAGVINVILKKDSEGADLSLSGGENMNRGDGEFYTALGHVGFNLDNRGFIDLSLSAKTQEASSRAFPVASSIHLYNLVNGAPDPRETTMNRLVTNNYGQFPVTSLGFGYNAGYELGSGIELYSFGTVTHRVSDLNGTFQAPSSSNRVLPEIYPNGTHPRNIYNEVDYEFTAGAQGTVAGWDWDFSSDYGINIAGVSADRTLNASLGPTSPTSFDGGTLASSQWVNNLDFTRRFQVGGGDLQVSAGLEHRLEHFSLSAGTPLMNANGGYVIPTGQPNAGQFPVPGILGASGIDPSAAGHAARNNFAAYVDLAYDPTSDLTIGAAGRFEHFDDASGDTVIGKINARYALTPWLAVRGDINNGFRAPSLGQEIYAATTPQQLPNSSTVISIKALPVNSPSAIALGATPLKPEKSLNYSGGVVLTPTDTFTLTLDAYSIDVYGHIVPTGALTGAAVTNILVANGLPALSSATYFTNAINTRTQGIDAVTTYRLDLGEWGQMLLNASVNYNVNSITHIIPNPPKLAALGPNFVIFDHGAVGNLTTGLPKTKIILGDTWTWSDFSLTPRFIRYGGFIAQNTNPALDRSFNAKWITDLELSWQATPMFNFAVGADNLFNVYPSLNGIFNPALGSQEYNPTPLSPFGFTGGFYYGRMTISLGGS